jgi:hypothetical protein
LNRAANPGSRIGFLGNPVMRLRIEQALER